MGITYTHNDVLRYLGRTGERANGRTDTDDGEFNSPRSSLREAGDKKVQR